MLSFVRLRNTEADSTTPTRDRLDYSSTRGAETLIKQGKAVHDAQLMHGEAS